MSLPKILAPIPAKVIKIMFQTNPGSGKPGARTGDSFLRIENFTIIFNHYT